MSSTTALPTGSDLIAAERKRQIEEEGYDRDHDRAHGEELVHAAIAYALDACDLHRFAAAMWPWDDESFKPTWSDPVRDLTKAGALIAAAIDALPKA